MNPLIVIGIGVGLVTWGFKQIARHPEKPLTAVDKGGTVKPDNAKDMPEPKIDDNEKANIDNSSSESGSVDTV
jgi:hypothetical protein